MKASRTRELFLAATLQAFGSLATLAAIAFLARATGPAVQGAFSMLKAEIEFLSALLLVGLPQAICYFLIVGRITSSQAVSLSIGHAGLVLLLLLLVWTLFAGDMMENLATPERHIVLAIVVLLFTLYANIRAMILAERSTLTFSVITALPSFLLLATVVVATITFTLLEKNLDYVARPSIFFIAYSLTVVATFWVGTRGRIPALHSVPKNEITGMLSYALANWIPPAAQAGATLFAYRWIESKLGLADGLGAFSAAVALVLALLVPLNMMIPIFFKWWSAMPNLQRGEEVLRVMTAVVACGLAGLIIVWLFEETIVRIVFGLKYLEFVGVFSLMAMSLVPQAVLRLWGVYCSSIGRPGLAAWVEIARGVSIIIFITVAGTTVNDTIRSWVVAEYVTLMVAGALAFLIRQRGRRPG